MNPNNAVAYYNRRNAMDKREKVAEDKEISELSREIGLLNLSSSPTNFVISTIGCVSKGNSSSNSSDEEQDDFFSDEMFKFNIQDENSMPFTTTRPQNCKRKKKCKERDFDDLPNLGQRDSKGPQGNSIVITPLLQKLSENGFEEKDRDKLGSISVSIGLNRMKSLSTRKNNLLVSELENSVETDIRYEKFGFYWKCDWYNKQGEIVEYLEVRKFYKQLKKIDSEKAQKFREIVEKNVPVPFQKLREYAKNHVKTKKLVREFRDKTPGANVYLSLIDTDTIDFNGIYSAYLRIVANCSTIPTVMTTGYEFPVVAEDKGGKVFESVSHIDRMIRVKTSYHLPLGVYYPEPNTCILIPPKHDTLPESFIYKSKRELPSLLINLQQNRKNSTFIFSEDKPLITSIPDRAKLTKSHKNLISFSVEFIQGASPTKKDLKSCKQVSQSHLHEKVWYDNLFVNGAIAIKEDPSNEFPYKLRHCKSLLAKIRNPKGTTDRDESIAELKKYIDSDVVDAIIAATMEVQQYVKQIEINYVRGEDEEKLLDILRKNNVKLDSISSREFILMLAQLDILELVEKKIINLHSLIKLDIEALEYICDDAEFIEMLNKGEIDFDSILCLLDKENLPYYENARKHYSVSKILRNYEKNPLHLKFMASMEDYGDDGPTEIVYENSNYAELVEFGVRNYDIDIDWIRSELRGDRDSPSAALMYFDGIIGYDFSGD